MSYNTDQSLVALALKQQHYIPVATFSTMATVKSTKEITLEEIRQFGRWIAALQVGNTVRVANERCDDPRTGTVIQTRKRLGDAEYYDAYLLLEDGTQAELHVNWRDIPEDDDDQITPYTGLLIGRPFDDTAPPVTHFEWED